eukprot:scaffold3505_cov60-Phaeocystis_antarctica.AAC.4
MVTLVTGRLLGAIGAGGFWAPRALSFTLHAPSPPTPHTSVPHASIPCSRPSLAPRVKPVDTWQAVFTWPLRRRRAARRAQPSWQTALRQRRRAGGYRVSDLRQRRRVGGRGWRCPAARRRAASAAAPAW